MPFPCSAKAGIGIEDILEAIVARVPAPKENPDKLLRCSVFDSLYDTYRGVVSYVRVFSGTVSKGQRVKLMATGKTYEVKEVGVFTPKMSPRDVLAAGDVGYVIANMKSASEVKIGDTITDNTHPCAEPLPGYKEIQPMVFSGIYPVDSSDYEALKMAMGKLQINDPAFTYSSESSDRARLRLPLRLPRPAPHGNHPGAPAPRVRHGRHLHLSVRDLSSHHDRRHRAASWTIPTLLPRPAGHPGNPRAHRERLHHGPRTNTSAT